MANKLAIFFACIVIAVTAKAVGYVVDDVPEAVFVDAEVSTNVVIQTRGRKTRHFSFAMEHTANLNNSLTVAFGCDIDEDGNLSEEEIDMSAGWDAGEWVIQSKRNEERLAWSGVSNGSTPRMMSAEMTLGSNASPKSIKISGGNTTFLESNTDISDWLFNADWDTAKVTARGCGVTAERVSIEISASGFIIRLR